MTIGTILLIVLILILVKKSTKVVKGRIEEAAGALTGNDRLRAKGQPGLDPYAI